MRITFKVVAMLLLVALFASPATALARCLLHTTHACCEAGGGPTVAPAPRSCCQFTGRTSEPAPMMTVPSQEWPVPQVTVAVTQPSAPTAPDIAAEPIGSNSKVSLAQLCILLI